MGEQRKIQIWIDNTLGAVVHNGYYEHRIVAERGDLSRPFEIDLCGIIPQIDDDITFYYQGNLKWSTQVDKRNIEQAHTKSLGDFIIVHLKTSLIRSEK